VIGVGLIGWGFGVSNVSRVRELGLERGSCCWWNRVQGTDTCQGGCGFVDGRIYGGDETVDGQEITFDE